MNWRHHVQRLQKEGHLLLLVFKHPRTRWYVRWLAACPVAYFFSPVQLIPSFIPVIGFLDDFLVLLIGVKLVRKFTPNDLLTECSALAEAAQSQQEANDQPGIARFALILTAATFLLAAVGAGAIVAAFVHRRL
jgi:uncharacterized membrane protein YkvA (DUF1232 family)